MRITYTQTSAELKRRFVPPTSLRQRFSLLLSFAIPLLYCAVAYISRWQAIVVDIVAGLYALVGILVAAAWAVSAYRMRTSKPVTHLVEISELSFYQQAAGTEQRYLWTDFGKIADVRDYFIFKSVEGRYLVFIPRSAFEGEDQAQLFLTQSRQYQETAKQRQQDKMQKTEGAWPPAPRPGT